ncbi:Wzz/FepE/Etk N-terminal domain-containing protein [Gammaproteobacteria bacterium]|nr:Wzz/FepE/Etk N-terminal domain-containing protein [Gammaproteobacteria bacterium]
MENNSIDKNSEYIDEAIDFRELFKVLWDGKFLVIAVTSIFSIAAVIYSLSLPNIYQSKAYLSPVGEQVGTGQGMQGVGGLASLAGISLSPQSGGSKSIKALEKLNSLSFFSENILPNIFLPDLMAIESWDESSNSIIYDRKIFDKETKAWLVEIPSAQQSYRAFNENLRIFKDELTGFVTIAVKHQSPYIAKEWTELIVNELNDFFRAKDKVEAKAAMNFLNAQIAQTSFTEIKQVIAKLLQEKTQQLTLIEVNDFYVFEYIDPPAVMEKKIEPTRSFICIVGAFLGAVLGVFIVLIRFYLREKKLQ